MALTQTSYSSTLTGRLRPEAGHPRGIADIPITLTERAPLRTVFVMNDELLRHGLVHVVSQASGVQFVGDLRHGAGLTDRLRALQPGLLVVGVKFHLHNIMGKFDVHKRAALVSVALRGRTG